MMIPGAVHWVTGVVEAVVVAGAGSVVGITVTGVAVVAGVGVVAGVTTGVAEATRKTTTRTN